MIGEDRPTWAESNEREPSRGGLHCLDHFLGGWPEDQDCPCVDRMARRNHLRVVK